MRVARPSAPRRGLLRRGLLVLLLVVLSVPVLLAPDRVDIAVDGETVQTRSYASTVEQALDAAGVQVGPDDAVAPRLGAPVADGLDIEVIRARPVQLHYEGRTRELPVAGETVEDVLVAAGLGEVRGVSIVPDPSTPLEDAGQVRVVEPVRVRIRVDGGTTVVRMKPGTVQDALDLAEVRVRGRDTVSRPLDEHLLGEDSTIRVTRRDRSQRVREVAVPFEERVVETDDLLRGEREVVQEGREGVREEVVRVIRVDGEVRRRKVVERRLVQEPVDRVIHVGTAEPPPPPEPEPAPPAQDDSVWDRLAGCESGGNWAAQGTYHGGLQFHPDTWSAWKPGGYPTHAYQASREQQIVVGKRLHAARGWSPWPHCSRELGLR